MNEETQIIEKPEPKPNGIGDTSHVGTVSLRGIIAAVVIGTVCVMAVLERTVQEPMYSIAVAIMGFYYGQKTK